jgi:hypothetical protein
MNRVQQIASIFRCFTHDPDLTLLSLSIWLVPPQAARYR